MRHWSRCRIWRHLAIGQSSSTAMRAKPALVCPQRPKHAAATAPLSRLPRPEERGNCFGCPHFGNLSAVPVSRHGTERSAEALQPKPLQPRKFDAAGDAEPSASLRHRLAVLAKPASALNAKHAARRPRAKPRDISTGTPGRYKNCSKELTPALMSACQTSCRTG